MSLEDELREQRDRSLQRLGEERSAVMARATAALAAEIAKGPRLGIGDPAPGFSLPDAHGGSVGLGARLAQGPVVLAFYRGAWCPYCNIQLRALQAALPEMQALGASLIAISPQAPDESLSNIEKQKLAFDVLSDSGCEVAGDYGVAFALAEELRPIYSDLGNALPGKNAADDWRLPIPATFVIAGDGRVAFADVDADYRNRAEPDAILATLTRLRRDTA